MTKDESHAEHDRQAEERIKAIVEQFGYHISVIPSSGYGPSFGYTIGLVRSYGHPEIILIGLKPEVLLPVLSFAGDAVKAGERIVPGQRYPDYIEGYDVQFLQVRSPNHRDYMGYCGWFYGYDWDFPVLQMVYPDKEGRFPRDPEFDPRWTYSQPLLDEERTYKFPEAPNTAAFTTRHVLEGAPVLHVSHGHDGSWQFHSEADPQPADGKVVSLGSMVRLDPSLNALFDLEYGKCAERKGPGGRWEYFELEEDAEEDEQVDPRTPLPAAPASKLGLWGRVKKLFS